MSNPMIFVYELPMRDKLANGYCFGGGVPINFLNVDWFSEDAVMSIKDCKSFIKSKGYYKPNARFLVLSTLPGRSFVIEAEHP